MKLLVKFSALSHSRSNRSSNISSRKTYEINFPVYSFATFFSLFHYFFSSLIHSTSSRTSTSCGCTFLVLLLLYMFVIELIPSIHLPVYTYVVCTFRDKNLIVIVFSEVVRGRGKRRKLFLFRGFFV